MLSCALVMGVSPLGAEVKLSEKLTKIADHLGEGGVHFSVTDAQEDLRDLARIGDKVISQIPDAGIPPSLRLERLFEDLGLFGYLGRGSSSHQIGNLWHNRSFRLTDGKHGGVFSLFGDPVAESVGSTFAPAGADLVMETSLDLRQVEKTVKKIAEAFGQEAEAEVTNGFSEEIAEIGISLADLFTDFKVHGTIAFWMDEENTFEVEEGVELPIPHLAARLDNAGVIWKLLQPQMEGNSRMEEKDGEIIMTPPEGALPTPFGEVLPTIVYNPKTKQLFMALSAEDLEACRGKGPKLGTTQAYQFATVRFPKKVNSQVYLSGDVFRLVEKLANQFVEQAPPEAQDIIKGLLPYLSDLGAEGGYAAAVAVEEDGILSVANTPFPVKGDSSLFGSGAIATLAVFAGLASPVVVKAKGAADKAKAMNEVKMVVTAMFAYKAEKEKFPRTMAEMIRAHVVDPEFLNEDIVVVPQKGNEEDPGKIMVYLKLPESDMVIVGMGDGSVTSLPFEVFNDRLNSQLEE